MKTTVNNLVTRLKRRIDYNITDTDLDNLLIDCINDSLKLIYQWCFDAGLFIDISTSTTLTTTASQAYIDISSSLSTADEILRVSERTNDKPVERISYEDFIAFFPDPTANSSAMPDFFSIWNNRLYLGPTPSATGTLYVEYLVIPTDVVAGDTLPYKSKYDPLLLATSRTEFLRFMDSENVAEIRSAEQIMEFYKQALITQATKRIGENRQMFSRREGIRWYPRIPETGGGYGAGKYGLGGYGL